MYSIYKLVNPICGSTFYIGITKRPIQIRLSHHLAAKRGFGVNSEMVKYIKKILDKGKTPEIVVVKTTSDKSLEKKFIDQFSKEHKLLNSCQIAKRLAIKESIKYKKSQVKKKEKIDAKYTLMTFEDISKEVSDNAFKYIKGIYTGKKSALVSNYNCHTFITGIERQLNIHPKVDEACHALIAKIKIKKCTIQGIMKTPEYLLWTLSDSELDKVTSFIKQKI